MRDNSDNIEQQAVVDAKEHIGYKSPPTGTRFKKGVSGNPRGRPKGSRNVATIIELILYTKIPVTENGIRRKISALEAMTKAQVNKALKGDSKAFTTLMKIMPASKLQPRDDSQDTFVLKLAAAARKDSGQKS